MSTEAAVNQESTDPQRQRLLATLDISGWGLPFRFLQPRNPCFWVFTVLTAWGAFQMWHQWSKVDLGAATLITSTVLLGLYGVVLGLIFLMVDRKDRQPSKLLVAAFIWGGVAATFGMAINANDALSDIYGKLFGHAFVIDWWAALSAPFVEETAKAAGFLLLLGLASDRIRSVCDALLVGAFLGLGFEILEDLIYTFNAAVSSSGSDQITAAIQMVIVRSSTGLFSHALYTALFCAGLVFLIGTPAVRRNTWRGVFLIVIAVGAHSVWDGAGAIADGGPATILVTTAVAIVGAAVFIYVFRLGAPQERAWMKDVLQPEVERGALTEDELNAVAGTLKEQRAFIKSPGGKRKRKGRRKRRRLLRTCRKLNSELAKSRGEESLGVEQARNGISQLRSAEAS